MNNKKLSKPAKANKKTEWEFKPTLKIEPQLNEGEILDFLAKLSRPLPKTSDPEKKETSA